jgi:hypothetical protein
MGIGIFFFGLQFDRTLNPIVGKGIISPAEIQLIR